jgi:hypothetical protein
MSIIKRVGVENVVLIGFLLFVWTASIVAAILSKT